MTTNADMLILELENSETEDEILSQVAKKTRSIIEDLGYLKKLTGLRIFFVDFNSASVNLRSSRYFTENCKALLDRSVVILNGSFLLELEAAIRSFNLADSLLYSQYLRSDEDLFGLIKRIRIDQEGYLHRLRKLAKMQIKKDGTEIVEALSMVALFFISHELGHLLDGKDQRSFTSFLKADADLEQSVANAVIKLCRHADEFKKFGFGLPGLFEDAVRKDSEIRKKELELRSKSEKLQVLYTNHTKWFTDEVSADKTGANILINYLEGIAKKDEFISDKYRYLTVNALFVTAIYSWHKDLLIFMEKIGIEQLDSKVLAERMMWNREQYVKVASLFGEVHRFTLLRSVLAIESILKARTGFSELSEDEKTIGFSQGNFDRGSDRKNLRKWWLADCLQKYDLLCTLMDTAVKIAYIGCSTGWYLEERKELIINYMNFESIDMAMDRLQGNMNKVANAGVEQISQIHRRLIDMAKGGK